MFQIVVLAHFGQEYVYQHVGIVHGYPLGIAQAVYGKRLGVGTLACEFLDRFNDGGYLAGRVTLADDEIVADGVVYLGKVGDYDFFFLFYLGYLQ